ncbi:MAG: FAD-dependent oxidoreductase [Pirellulaceae bacterium]
MTLPVVPIRGQMLLYKFDQPPFSYIVNEGPRYLVPRLDGHVLVGSTMEEAGFDSRTTAAGEQSLEEFACSISPMFQQRKPIRAWAGLRPASFDGLPYIGWIPNVNNALVATGHFRLGLQSSPGTAHIIACLLDNTPPPIDLEQFRPGRTLG